MKRAFDVTLAALGIVCVLPVLSVAAVLIRFSSPGPVLFRQRRIGRNGKPFFILKLRTMRQGEPGPHVTASSDPRITRIGRFLRKRKLDELPQLLNVLRGEMSLVGPRPEVERYVNGYTAEERAVLQVRPGITGVSQLRYRNEEQLLAAQADPEEYYIREVMPAKLALDLEYVRSRSLRTDIAILIATVLGR